VTRLYGAACVGIVLLLGLFLFVRYTHQPVAVVCDRGRPNVKLTSTNKHGYFVEHQIGPCVTYTHKVRH
jgi:hypothetical protein